MNSKQPGDLVTSSEGSYREYLKKRAEVERKRQIASDLQQRIQDLRQVLGQFMVEYHARVGTLQVQLDKIKLQIEEVRFRIHWLISRETEEGMDEQVEQQFSGYREQVREEESEATHARSAYAESLEEEKLPPESKKELKRLYRELAKRFHPDLADSKEERERRNGIMAEVNAAYDREDLDALQEMLDRLEWEEAEAKAETWIDKIEALDMESQRLDSIIAGLECELAELNDSNAFRLRQKVEQAAEQGRDLLEELCEDLRWEIEEAKQVLADYQTRYDELLQEHTTNEHNGL